MANIIFYPQNKKVEFLKNNTILEIAFKNDIYVPSLCEEGACSACMVEVLSGKEFLKEGNNNNVGKNILACITNLQEEYFDKDVEILIDVQEL